MSLTWIQIVVSVWTNLLQIRLANSTVYLIRSRHYLFYLIDLTNADRRWPFRFLDHFIVLRQISVGSDSGAIRRSIVKDVPNLLNSLLDRLWLVHLPVHVIQSIHLERLFFIPKTVAVVFKDLRLFYRGVPSVLIILIEDQISKMDRRVVHLLMHLLSLLWKLRWWVRPWDNRRLVLLLWRIQPCEYHWGLLSWWKNWWLNRSSCYLLSQFLLRFWLQLRVEIGSFTLERDWLFQPYYLDLVIYMVVLAF